MKSRKNRVDWLGWIDEGKMRMNRFLLVAAAVSGLLFVMPAYAQDPTGVFGLLGLTPSDEPEIDYRERPPLVVPPNSVLRAPTELDPVAQAAWPKDPDVLRRKRKVIAAREPANFDKSITQEYIESEQKRKRKQAKNGQLRNDTALCRMIGGCFSTEPPPQGVQAAAVDPLLPSGEPRRVYLTDPPTGLRLPAPPVQ